MVLDFAVFLMYNKHNIFVTSPHTFNAFISAAKFHIYKIGCPFGDIVAQGKKEPTQFKNSLSNLNACMCICHLTLINQWIDKK